MNRILLSLAFLTLLASCGTKKVINEPEKNMTMNSMYEIAINQSKEGQHENFLETRAKFVEVLGKEEATLNEGKWTPFFTVNPDLPLDQILIGMTEWSSMEGFGEAAGRLMPQKEAKDYFASFDPLAYAILETTDGKPFDMEDIKKEGLVVEFAIRKGNTQHAFGENREIFFNSLENYDGYKFAREFKVYKLSNEGMPLLAENTQAVIIVWDDVEKFQAAATPIFGTEEYQNFAANLEVETYFASFPMK